MMLQGKILIIKMQFDGFERFCNDNFRRLGCDICILEEMIKNNPKKGMSDITLYKNIKLYAKEHDWKKYDTIILFDAVYLVPAIAFAKKRKCKLIVWFWNTIEAYQKKRIVIAKLFSELWSFDEKDASRYRLKYSNQFYFEANTTQYTKGEGVFFVGADKGRSKILADVAKRCKKEGISCDFYILKDPSESYDESVKEFLIQERTTYEFVLNHIRNSEAVLDLVKEGQVGLTVRVLEAVFNGKKIITNNASIQETDIYKSGNVYILDKESQNLGEFIRQELRPYSTDMRARYNAEHWLERIIGHRNG